MTSQHDKPKRWMLLVLAVPTVIGAVAGSLLLGPYMGITRTDPNGTSIAAGVGGFVGLVVGFLLRPKVR